MSAPIAYAICQSVLRTDEDLDFFVVFSTGDQPSWLADMSCNVSLFFVSFLSSPLLGILQRSRFEICSLRSSVCLLKHEKELLAV